MGDLQDFTHLLRRISGTIQAGIILQAADGSILHANKMACDVFGMKEEEIAEKTSFDPVWEMVLEDGTPARGEEHPSMVTIRTGEPIRNTVRGLFSRDESKTRWLLINTEPIFDPATDKMEAVLITFVDITRRKVAEATLRSSEEMFRSITTNSPNYILTLDLDYNITFVNRSYTGKSLEEITKSNLLDYIPEESKDEVRDTLDKVKRTGEQGMYEVTSKWIDGPATTFEARISPILRNGEVDAFIVSFSNITDRKIVEKELDHAHRLSNLFMESMPGFVVLLDFNQTIVASNSIARELGGLPGKKCYEMFGLEEVCPWCLASELRETGEPQEVVVEVTGRMYDAHWILIENDLYIHYAFDISEKIKTEEEKLILEKQVLDAQKVESLGVLAGGIAHDFNNLLMGVMGNVGMAQMNLPHDSSAVKYLRGIETAAQKAADLTNQMLAYSGKGRFIVKPVDLSGVVSEMVSLLNSAISSDASLRLNLAEDLPAVEVDLDQVSQIVMNLITNASDAMRGKAGAIKVVTESVTCDAQYLSGFTFGEDLEAGNYVSLEISDTGSGMSQEILDRMFDPFFSTKEWGRGLGLSAVMGIVRGHGGAIRVSSSEGEGTTFTIIFPASGKAIEKTVEVKGTEEGFTGVGTVLVVDDEIVVREIATAILTNFGFKVLQASDGSEALEIFREHSDDISLVLTDITMPVMGGLETLRNLRQIDPGIKVILSSGYSEEDALSAQTGEKLADFIQKPYKANDLISKVTEVLKKK
jgi:PAS domain S-box-containing protein